MAEQTHHFSSSAKRIHRKPRQYKPKVKTGCTTCRIRRIKCDEGKPQCQKCLRTGRACDGYIFTIRQTSFATHPTSSLTTVSQIADSSLLSDRYQASLDNLVALDQPWKLSSLLGLENSVDKAAQDYLHFGLYEPAVHHALLATGSLAAVLAQTRNKSALNPQYVPNFSYALQHYSEAMMHLAERLSKPDHASRRVALICCRQFIAIEAIQNNYSLMVAHLVRGLRIMNEGQARPGLDSEGNFIPAGTFGLSLPDTFIIKLFSGPFPTVRQRNKSAGGESGAKDTEVSKFERLLHKGRKELVLIAAAILDFLAKASEINSASEARALKDSKANLISELQMWLLEFEPKLTAESGPQQPPPVASYLLLFHYILIGVLEPALKASQKLDCYDDVTKECRKPYLYADILTLIDSPIAQVVRAGSCSESASETDTANDTLRYSKKALSRVPLDMGWVSKDVKFSDWADRWTVLTKWVWKGRTKEMGV